MSFSSPSGDPGITKVEGDWGGRVEVRVINLKQGWEARREGERLVEKWKARGRPSVVIQRQRPAFIRGQCYTASQFLGTLVSK